VFYIVVLTFDMIVFFYLRMRKLLLITLIF